MALALLLVALALALAPGKMLLFSRLSGSKFTNYGHPERPFFQKLETFGLGQTNLAEIL